ALIKAARETDLDAVVALAVRLGLRMGEILGLRWTDVDFDAGTVSVNQTLKEARRRAADGVYFVDLRPYAPKTAKSRRTLTLPSPAPEALTRRRRLQLQDRLPRGEV